MQQVLLPVVMSNFNPKNIKIVTNSALKKAGPKTFLQSEENF